MNKENSQKIINDFPALFDKKYMSWGFECDDGWFDLIYKLCDQLNKLSKWENCEIGVMQVKEKYGTLRFYTTGITDIMFNCIINAEYVSAQTCEICGKTGKTRGNGWLKTLCIKHAEELNYPLEEWELNFIKEENDTK